MTIENNDKREVTLHIGLPKTATTSIQDSIFANAELLKAKYGIDYCPDLCNLADVNCTGHHPLAWAEFFQTHTHYKPLNNLKIKERLKSSNRIFLSSEWFSMANSKQLSTIIDKWGLPDNRRVLLVYRNEFEHIRSNWLQAVKMGHSLLSLNDFYFHRYKPGRSTLSNKIKKWTDLGFKVDVFSFEDLKRSNHYIAIEVLNCLYNININKKEWNCTKVSNVSPPPNTVDLYRRLINFIRWLVPSCCDKWTEAEYSFSHNKVCHYLSYLPSGGFKKLCLEEKIIRDDLKGLPNFYDH